MSALGTPNARFEIFTVVLLRAVPGTVTWRSNGPPPLTALSPASPMSLVGAVGVKAMSSVTNCVADAPVIAITQYLWPAVKFAVKPVRSVVVAVFLNDSAGVVALIVKHPAVAARDTMLVLAVDTSTLTATAIPVLFALMRTKHLLHLATSLVCAASILRAQSQPTLIVNASVIDGTGAPARPADVRILNGRIDAIGHRTRHPGDRVVDAHGLALAPGFIDTHSH